MGRSLIILFGVIAVAGAVLAGSFLVSRRICMAQITNPADDLDWLRQEFRLNDSEIARVRKLHDGYLPKCGEMCNRIAAKKQEVRNALAAGTNITAEVENKVMELSELRAQCQLQMLRHFAEVSHAMPPEQGRRYLAEMQRLTLGFHEQIEESMSDHSDHGHGHH